MDIKPEVMAELEKCEFTDTSVKLAGQMDRKLYLAVNEVLETAGGKWNKKAKAHVFLSDPKKLLGMAIATGALDETVAREANYADIKKARAGKKLSDKELMQVLGTIPDFFPTPEHVIEEMIEECNLQPGDRVLEPSAGKGNIALLLKQRDAEVQCVEYNPMLADHLSGLGFDTICDDFLKMDPQHWGNRGKLVFDAVIMNPPFSRGIDKKHIEAALRWVRPGGRVVAIASRTTALKMCIPEAMERRDLPDDTFKNSERKTGVRTSMLVFFNPDL